MSERLTEADIQALETAMRFFDSGSWNQKSVADWVLRLIGEYRGYRRSHEMACEVVDSFEWLDSKRDDISANERWSRVKEAIQIAKESLAKNGDTSWGKGEDNPE